ncbi:acyltransferase family protein [Tsuneonella amylolytica]|uniref:acyltransferase family protein n=1 Tax=Tsuneonella amylolytica TaxID=2338327 RepID=UPI000EA96BCE|nr:acyltransferase [Tsuneonella amylolytica]
MTAKEQAHRLTYLDGWRGLAILFVLLGHFGPFGAMWGSFGVELFFVLSGRLMAHILYIERMGLRKFFWRRFSRIYPVLLVFVLAMLIVTFAAQAMGREEGTNALTAFSALTFWINLYGAFGGNIAGPLDHLWSIAIEEHSYAILAAMSVAVARNRKIAVWLCICLSILAMINGAVLYYKGAGYVHEIYWRTDVRIAPVFLSAGLYLLTREIRNPHWALPPVFLLCAATTFHSFGSLPLKMTVPTLMLAYAVNTIEYSHEFVRRFLSLPVFVWAGLISYSLYIWQQPFYKVANGSSWALFPAVILAMASYFLVETPARRWLNRRRIGDLPMDPIP